MERDGENGWNTYNEDVGEPTSDVAYFLNPRSGSELSVFGNLERIEKRMERSGVLWRGYEADSRPRRRIYKK